MPDFADRAKPAIENLMQSDESQLYEELGLRLKAIAADESVAGSFEPNVTYNAQLMGATDDLRLFGQKFFSKVSREAYGLICGGGLTPEERQKMTAALGNKADYAALLATLLVTYFGLAPAVATVSAALVLRLFFRPAHEAMCEVWATKVTP